MFFKQYHLHLGPPALDLTSAAQINVTTVFLLIYLDAWTSVSQRNQYAFDVC